MLIPDITAITHLRKPSKKIQVALLLGARTTARGAIPEPAAAHRRLLVLELDGLHVDSAAELHEQPTSIESDSSSSHASLSAKQVKLLSGIDDIVSKLLPRVEAALGTIRIQSLDGTGEHIAAANLNEAPPVPRLQVL